ITGPTLRFRSVATIAITGADFNPRLDGSSVPTWQSIDVKAGSTLEFDTVSGAGARAYLAIAGGFDAPTYLGSASTFILGKFGGFTGRVLRSGDVLAIGKRGTAYSVPQSAAVDSSDQIPSGQSGLSSFFSPDLTDTRGGACSQPAVAMRPFCFKSQ